MKTAEEIAKEIEHTITRVVHFRKDNVLDPKSPFIEYIPDWTVSLEFSETVSDKHYCWQVESPEQADEIIQLIQDHITSEIRPFEINVTEGAGLFFTLEKS